VARILALDIGTRRIGLAVSDELGITAQGLPTLQRSNLRADLDALSQLIQQYSVHLVLAGNPLHMSGDDSPGTTRAVEFTDLLRARTGVEIRLWDERLTTREASRVLRESGISIQKRAQAVDRLSAVILLKSYLDSLT
jgi:putative pre-16S rRNA nuclease